MREGINLEEYKISKVTNKNKVWYNGIDEDWEVIGYDITLTNVKNPFDFFIQFIPVEAYTDEEFKIGRIIELEN